MPTSSRLQGLRLKRGPGVELCSEVGGAGGVLLATRANATPRDWIRKKKGRVVDFVTFVAFGSRRRELLGAQLYVISILPTTNDQLALRMDFPKHMIVCVFKTG